MMQTIETKEIEDKIQQLKKTIDLKKRIVQENRILREYNQKESEKILDSKQSYVFDSKWIEYYKRYLDSSNKVALPPPNRVENKPIEEKIMIDKLTDNDFYSVGQNTAKFIYLLYRGGPIISQYNIEEMKKEAEVKRSNLLQTPSKSSREDNVSEDRFTLISSNSSQLSYTRKTKTKSELERRLANSRGYVESLHDALDDRDGISIQYNVRHRGDSPTQPMDEEEDNINSQMNREKSEKNTIERYKRNIQQYIDKNRIVLKSSVIEFDKHIKKSIQYKMIDMLDYIQSINKHVPVYPLDDKYSSLSLTKIDINCNGLENDHVYCYLNAMIQLLMNVKDLVVYFLNSNDISSHTKYSYQLKKFIETYQKKNLALIDATPLLNIFKSKVDVNEQQDVDEVLRLLFDVVQKELKPQSKKKQNNLKYDWVTYCMAEDTILTYLFAGETQRSTVCFNCQHISSVSEIFDVLSLSIPSYMTDINSVIDSNFNAELIEDSFLCSGCDYRVPAVSRLFFSQLPQYLIIQLKRFSTFPKPCKSTTVVKYKDGDILHLKKYDTMIYRYTILSRDTSYQLISTVHHIGSITNGHYKISSKRGEKVEICNIQWYLFDDDKVYDSDIREVLDKESYILLYKRIIS